MKIDPYIVIDEIVARLMYFSLDCRPIGYVDNARRSSARWR